MWRLPGFSPMTACRSAGATGWRLAERVKATYARAIVVYHLDRFARDLAATPDYLRRS